MLALQEAESEGLKPQRIDPVPTSWSRCRSFCGFWETVLGEGTGDPFKQKIHSVGERAVAFVFVGWGRLAGGLGSAFGWAGLDWRGAQIS